MCEYDEACISPETSRDNTAKAYINHEPVNIEHSELVTA